MKTRQLAGRFAVASLLTFLAPIVLCLPQTYAETYVGGQLGLTFPGNGLSSGDLTSTSAPFSGTPSGGGPTTSLGTNELTSVGIQGANFHVLTIAPLNFVFRYPGNRLQPYIGVGPGLFIGRLKDPSITQGDNSQSSTKLGLNSFIG